MSDNKNYPLVSVIIPTYNRSGLLKQTVESVLGQTYPNIEIIVIDDGSTDDTAEVMKSFSNKITYIRQENQGSTVSRNNGFLASKGKFVNFLDHDDLFLPEKIEKQMNLLRKYPKAGLVHCGYYNIDKDGKIIDIVNFLPEGDVKERIVSGCFLWSGAPLIRRECFDKVGLFDNNVWSSDADMWVKISLAGYHFGCVQEPLGCYRILPDSEMSNVEITEKLDMKNLDDFFSNADLPSNILRMKTEAYFNQRFWLSCRYYTIGKWDDAKRNLDEAVKLRPEILTDNGSELFDLFLTNALDPRVDNPVKFIDDVYGHLPEDVYELMYDFHDSITSWIYVGTALHNYAYGKIQLAKDELEKAIALNDDIIRNINDFYQTLGDYIFRLPVNPAEYVDMVLKNLPENGKVFSKDRSRIIGQIFLRSAYLNFTIKRRRISLLNLLRALLNYPGIVFPVSYKILSLFKWKLLNTIRTIKEVLMVNNASIKLNPGNK